MLVLLKIRNLALIDELTWEPKAGFLGITGETGAGKSVILGGLDLALGERADKGMIRSGETQCSVEAVFELPPSPQLDSLLEEAGVPPCEEGELLIRRIVTSTGNRQFINNTPVTLSFLQRVGSRLVDRHHPESHRSLTSRERQLHLLDAYASAIPLRLQYEQAYQSWREARRNHRALLEAEQSNERELDFLRHQVEEIESAAFTAEEIPRLEQQWQRIRNASRLQELAQPMVQQLYGEEAGMLTQLHQLVRQGRELQRWDSGCTAWLAPLDTLAEELEQLGDRLIQYTEALGLDPQESAKLEERLNLLESLKRKYGTDYDSIMTHARECQAKLDAVEHREEKLNALAAQEKECYHSLVQIAAKLSRQRRHAAPRLEKDFLAHAVQLGFRQALFQIQFQEMEEPGPEGGEQVEFLFGPNPGEPLKALRLIASSGELARVMLALKSALAKQDDTPLLIFDEIDANVGGEIARAVGVKMQELGQQHQVIAITHFPQVAALANHHYLITKQTEGGRTFSRLHEVQGNQRVEELMRMLGTDGEAAQAHARALLLPK